METRALVPRRQFTVEDYYRMAEVGILHEDDRVELVEGQVIEMPPIGPRHATSVTGLANRLTGLVGERAVVRTQQPIRLTELSEPQPDVVLVRPPNERYLDAHPGPTDILLIVEVAETSALYDRTVKLPLYARSRIPEYWIVDLDRGIIEVHREPRGDRYAEHSEVTRDDRVGPVDLPDAILAAAEILGT